MPIMRHSCNSYFSISDFKNRLKVLGFTPNSRAVPLTPFFLAAALRACKPCFLSPDLLTLVRTSIPYPFNALATMSFEHPRILAASRIDFPSLRYRWIRSFSGGVCPVDGLPFLTSKPSASLYLILPIVRIIGQAGRLHQ